MFVSQNLIIWTSDWVKFIHLPTSCQTKIVRCWRCSLNTWWSKCEQTMWFTVFISPWRPHALSPKWAEIMWLHFSYFFNPTHLDICRQCLQSQWRKPNDSFQHGCCLWTHADEGKGRDCGSHVGYQVPKYRCGDSDWRLQKGMFTEEQKHSVQILFYVYLILFIHMNNDLL